MAFVTLSFLELIHSFNIKSENSIFKTGLFKNWYLIGAALFGILVEVIVIIIPKISKIFHTVPLNSVQWIYVIIISILPIIIVESQKKINQLRFEKISCQIWKHNV